MADTTVLGIGQLAANFKALRTDMETRVARAMVVAAGGVLKKKAKEIALSNGSKRTGAMIKNIVIKREKDTPAGTTQYHLGVRHGRDLTKSQKNKGKKVTVLSSGRLAIQYMDDPYYWRWVEQGHKVVGRATGDTGTQELAYTRKGRSGKLIRYTRKRSADSLRARRARAMGAVAARPFIEPALAQGREQAIAAMAARLNAELEKANRAPAA